MKPALYNVHEVTSACMHNCAPHLVAVVLGKEPAETLAATLNIEHTGCLFVATLRDLNEPFTHFADASFDYRR